MAWDYTNDYSSTILAYTSGAGTITVVSVTGLPASGKYFILKVDDEYFLCTSYTGLVLTVAGGQASSTPANHFLGASITGCWIVPQVLDGIKSDIKAASALVLLEQHTASSSATLDFTTCISSVYDEYEIHFLNVLAATNSVTFQMLMSTDGGSTYDTSAIYQNNAGIWLVGVADAAYNNAATVGILQTNVNNLAGYGISGKLTLTSPGSAMYKSIAGMLNSVDVSSGDRFVAWAIANWYSNATAVNAFRFKMSSGNIASGTVRVYGVAKL